MHFPSEIASTLAIASFPHSETESPSVSYPSQKERSVILPEGV